jgi:hypothetical protein
VNATPRPLYFRETDSVPVVQGTGWAPGPFRRVRKISPPGIRSSYRLAHSESLYLRRCAGSLLKDHGISVCLKGERVGEAPTVQVYDPTEGVTL